MRKVGLTLDRVRDKPFAGERYVIPSGNVRDFKALRTTVRACGHRPADCDAEVNQHLYPLVTAHAQSQDVEFSIVRMRIDLREVQRDIMKLVSREVEQKDFLRLDEVVSRWKPCATPFKEAKACSPSVRLSRDGPVYGSGGNPLTAAFVDVPAEHDGKSVFHFQVAFSQDIASQDIANSYRTLRD